MIDFFFLPQYESAGHNHEIGLHSNSFLSALLWTALTFKSFLTGFFRGHRCTEICSTPQPCAFGSTPRTTEPVSYKYPRTPFRNDPPRAPRDNLRGAGSGPPACAGCEPGEPSEPPPSAPLASRPPPALPSHDQRCPGSGSTGEELGVCFACQGGGRGGGGGGGSHFCVRMRRMHSHRPPPQEASFSLLSTPDSRALKTTKAVGKRRKRRLRKGAAGPPRPQGRSLSPPARPRRRHCPRPPRAAAGPGRETPCARGGKGRQREEGVGRCDALNAAISFRDLAKKK